MQQLRKESLEDRYRRASAGVNLQVMTKLNGSRADTMTDMQGVDGMLPKVTIGVKNISKDLTQKGLDSVVLAPQDAIRFSKCVYPVDDQQKKTYCEKMFPSQPLACGNRFCQ